MSASLAMTNGIRGRINAGNTTHSIRRSNNKSSNNTHNNNSNNRTRKAAAEAMGNTNRDGKGVAAVAAAESDEPFIGSASTFLRFQNERREDVKILSFTPTGQWWDIPLRATIPAYNHQVMVLLTLYSVGIVLMAKYTDFCGDGHDSPDSDSFCSDDWVFHKNNVSSTLSIGMFLLLAFRANQAHDRFWTGKKLWEDLMEACRNMTRLICHHIVINDEEEAIRHLNDENGDKQYGVATESDFYDRRRCVAFVNAFPVALKLHLRQERHILRDLDYSRNGKADHHHDLLQLCYQDIANIENCGEVGMPLFCLDVMAHYLQKQIDSDKMTHHILSVINTTCIAKMNDVMSTCELIRNTPIPLSYVVQLRFLVFIWILLYPLSAVGDNGFYTIPSSIIIIYTVLGIESMAYEIEDPFGYDLNDIDLDGICDRISDEVGVILYRVEHPDKKLLLDRLSVLERGRGNFKESTMMSTANTSATTTTNEQIE